MPTLFGIDIAGILASTMGPGLLDATLIEPTTASPRYDPDDLSAGLQRTTARTFSCKGFMEQRGERFGSDGVVIQGGVYVSLLGGTLRALGADGTEFFVSPTEFFSVPSEFFTSSSGGYSYPRPGWSIVIEETTYLICGDGVTSDPAAAVYTCRVESS